MEIACQRCHETLRDADRYCAVCGLPQLSYVAADMPPIPAETSEGEREGGRAVGRSGDGLSQPQEIAWRPALNAAITLAVPAAVLCFGIPPIGVLGMFAAAAWAVSLYARRSRSSRVTAHAGAQIGMATGIFASWLTIALYGSGLWISRFVLHQGSEWDTLWLEQVETSNRQMLAQMGAANAQSVQIADGLHRFMLSAEGRAGLPLSGLCVVAALAILMAMLGGAAGARWATPRRSRS